MKNLWYQFWKEEDGIGVVEMILILVVLIGLVIIFKSQLTTDRKSTRLNSSHR